MEKLVAREIGMMTAKVSVEKSKKTKKGKVRRILRASRVKTCMITSDPN
jgi:hypothetical protein